MALNGNDRYFRNRYANGTSINFMTIEEYWSFKTHKAQFMFMVEYLERIFNLKVNLMEHKVSQKDFYHHFYTFPYFFRKAHVIFDNEVSSFFEGRLDHFTPSPPWRTLKSIIVSHPQLTVTSTSWSFLNMDTEVEILMVSTLVILSLLLVIHSIVTNKYKSLPTRKAVKKLTQETLGNVWDNASLLCAEPIPIVFPYITCRILAASWMIGATFILFFLGCFMRTEFTTESYNRIDSLSDLIKSGIQPFMVSGTTDVAYLENLSKYDEVVKEWLDHLDRKKMFWLDYYRDLVEIDSYIPVFSGKKAMILQESHLPRMMRTSNLEKFFLNKGGLHFSRDSVTYDYLHFIFNASWMRESQQILKNIQLSVSPLFEMQIFKYHDFQLLYSIERVTWKRPLKGTEALNLSSVSVPFFLLLTLLSATVPVVITEIIFNQYA